jgi:hypothetical protein
MSMRVPLRFEWWAPKLGARWRRFISFSGGTGLALAVGLAIGCTQGDRPEPVEECQQYEALRTSCLHRDAGGFAEQPALIPKDKADRERIRQVCSENLERLKRACR